MIKDSMAVGNGYSKLHWNRELDFVTGDIATPHGWVSLYMQGRLEGGKQTTRLDFIANKKVHIWTYNKAYSDRYLVTLAKRMAAELSS